MKKTSISSEKNEVAVEEFLGAATAKRFWQRPVFWGGLVAVIVLGAGAYFWLGSKQAAKMPVFVSEPVVRGDLSLSISATGTLQPTRTVEIGSELSGTVANVLVDVNDFVKAGQVLVELDTANLLDAVARAKAALASAEANVKQAVATVTESNSNLKRLKEVSDLSGGKVPSRTEMDTAIATLERAKANEASTRAAVVEAKAALATSETNLAKASIRSPIDGVVLTRDVDPGNAVAASLQAVTLFTIAEDLSKLKLEVNVDEADIGQAEVGQSAYFTVSSWPNRRYPAVVTRVNYGSTITDNVVTYTTTLEVDNDDLSLRPGMTASATITSSERRDVLLVPNTALRFTPLLADGATAQSSSSGGLMSGLMPRMPRQSNRPAASTGGAADGTKQIWVLQSDGQAVGIAVVSGLSDGKATEIVSGDLQAGMQVITDQRSGG